MIVIFDCGSPWGGIRSCCGGQGQEQERRASWGGGKGAGTFTGSRHRGKGKGGRCALGAATGKEPAMLGTFCHPSAPFTFERKRKKENTGWRAKPQKGREALAAPSHNHRLLVFLLLLLRLQPSDPPFPPDSASAVVSRPTRILSRG